MTGAPSIGHNLRIYTLSVVTDALSKLILIVVDLRFDAAGTGMAECISDRFASYPMYFVLDERGDRLRLALESHTESCRVPVRAFAHREFPARRLQQLWEISLCERIEAQIADRLAALGNGL